MDKKQLIEAVVKATGKDSETVGKVVDATLREIEATLKSDGKVTLSGFGTFGVRRRRKGAAVSKVDARSREGVVTVRVPEFSPESQFTNAVRMGGHGDEGDIDD